MNDHLAAAFAETCAQIEDYCARDVGRNIARLAAFARGDLARATRALLSGAVPPAVAILTGCFIPEGTLPAAETDGPIGAAMLADALKSMGLRVALVTDAGCARAVDIAVRVVTGARLAVAIVDGVDAGRWTWLDSLQPPGGLDVFTHVVAIERLGAAADGRVYSVRGEDRTSTNATCDVLYRSCRWHRIAIGDGGNEIGMGKVPHALVAEDILFGGLIHSTTRCDELVVAGCANWGAMGLVASLAAARPEQRAEILRPLNGELHHAALAALIDSGAAVDGLSGLPAYTVDGVPEDEHAAFIDGLRCGFR